MRLLLDTDLVVETKTNPERLSQAARQLIEAGDNEIFFSAVSIWEVTIKSMLRRPEFDVDPEILRQDLEATGFAELPLTSAHAIQMRALPSIHKDPFDRILVAQATHEGMVLLTTDARIADYPGPIRKV